MKNLLLAVSLSAVLFSSCKKEKEATSPQVSSEIGLALNRTDSTDVVYNITGSFSAAANTTVIAAADEAFRTEILQRVNKLRSEGCQCGSTYMPPVHPLKWNTKLETAASKYAAEMAAKNWFSHTSPDGTAYYTRIYREGYTIKGFRFLNTGENIARGQTSIENVMKSWTGSSGHCKNMMSKYYRDLGVAMGYNAAGKTYKTYWVMDLGAQVPFGGFPEDKIK